jgi:DNA-binding protein HU-beta
MISSGAGPGVSPEVRVNKSDLIEAIAEKVGGRQAATVAVETIIDTVTRAVTKGERVALSGFGVFEKTDRAARTGRNPATGAIVKIKKTSVPKFRPGTEFKAYVNGSKKFAKAAPAKTVAAKAPVKKATPVKAAVKATPAKKAPVKAVKATPAAKKTVAKKVVAKATPAKKTVATKTVAKASPAKKTVAKATPAKKTVAKATPAKKTAAKKTVAKKTAR